MQLMRDHGLEKMPRSRCVSSKHSITCDRGLIELMKVAGKVVDDDLDFHCCGNFVSRLLLARGPRDQFYGTDVMIVSAIG